MEQPSELNGFQEWLQKRAKTDVSQSWAGILLFICGSERSAFSQFFELFEEFQQQKVNNNSDRDENSVLTAQKIDRDLFEFLAGIRKRPGMYKRTQRKKL